MKRIRFLPAAITPVFPRDLILAAFTNGNGVKKFETKLADYFSQNYAFTFGSLMRTVYACFIGLSTHSKRRKVILPRYTCPSFIHGVLAANLNVDYCDVDPITLSIDLKSLAQFKMEEVLAVVCTNLFGLTSEVDKICNLCQPCGTFVVEGVDYGIGTEYKNKRIGTWGDVTILNFQEGKAIPVGGGAVVSSLPVFRDLYGKYRRQSFPNYLTMLGFTIFSRPTMYALFMKMTRYLNIERKKFSMEDTIRKTSTETDFSFDSDNYDCSISSFQGYLACRIMDRLEHDLYCRYENAKLLSKNLADVKMLQIVKKLSSVNKVNFIRFPVLIGQGQRDLILSQLLRKGIEASPMYVEHGMQIDASKFPGAARVAAELLTLPCHPYMNEEDANTVDEVFN